MLATEDGGCLFLGHFGLTELESASNGNQMSGPGIFLVARIGRSHHELPSGDRDELKRNTGDLDTKRIHGPVIRWSFVSLPWWKRRLCACRQAHLPEAESDQRGHR